MTLSRGENKKRVTVNSYPFQKLAVWTRLELATPCVTGMYSNQLNYRTKYFKELSLFKAVWTRLELATPCVTGMYSNQLNYRTKYFKELSLFKAVWTRLELATPCVTGMYSNQLNYQTNVSIHFCSCFMRRRSLQKRCKSKPIIFITKHSLKKKFHPWSPSNVNDFGTNRLFSNIFFYIFFGILIQHVRYGI